MPKTLAPPVWDKGMWRRLIALCHPDRHGDAALFVWVSALKDHVLGDRPEEPRPEYVPPRRSTRADSPRVTFDPSRTFEEITVAALAMAADLEEPYRSLLGLLEGARQVTQDAGPLYRQQRVGATYKSIAALCHRAGLGTGQRTRFYRISETLGLTQAHIGHLHKALQGEAA